MATKGWDTTDADEIGVRQKRAQKENFEIINLQPKRKIFSTYEVKSKRSVYLVELRSLRENINTCNCPDSEVNRLGTCKHIEAVKLLHKGKKSKSKYVEIYLDTRDDTIAIRYPNQKTTPLREKLDPYFSANGQLLHEPTVAFPSLQRQIQSLEPSLQKEIRISSLIESWLKAREFALEKITNKNVFLEDYKKGKRSLDFLKCSLYEYQKEGVLHLAFNERALLADDMGLGKTIQAIGASVLLQRLKGVQKVLVITPASLKTEWEEQIGKFTDLKSRFIFGNRKKRAAHYASDAFFYLANYEQILYDFETINTTLQPDIVILDEAQRIKNWQTKTANSVKRLQSHYAFVLTGTPLENKIDEIYSIVQFLDPKIFGPLFRFNRDFYQLDDKGMAVGYKNMNALHKKLAPIMLRRKKTDIEDKLPERIDKTYFVQMEQVAQVRYDEYESMVSRLANQGRNRPLSADELKRLQLGLSCMRMLCDSPYILDQKYTNSPKIDELMPILEELLAQEKTKIIIFSEWERMLQLLYSTLEKKGIKVVWHTGSLSQLERKKEIQKFKEDDTYRLFLSTDSGSVGLNLQVANVVVNLDMPWNPAKLEQRIARAWRKQQKHSVQVINLITEDRLEHRIVEVVKQKQFLSDNVLDGLGKDQLNLPSTRQQFLDELDAIMHSKTPTKQDNLEFFTQDVVSMLSDRVAQIMHNQATGSVLVVVDNKDETLTSRLESIQQKTLQNSTLQLMQVDEYEKLQKLARTGFIDLKKDDLKTLYEPSPQTPPEKISPEATQKINALFATLKRKRDMATLLHKGGFKEESLPAFIEMIENGLNIFEILGEEDYKTPIDFDAQFIEQIEEKSDLESKILVEKAYRFYEQMQTLMEELR